MNVCEQRGSLSIPRKGSLNRSRIKIYFRFGRTCHLSFSLAVPKDMYSKLCRNKNPGILVYRRMTIISSTKNGSYFSHLFAIFKVKKDTD